jgi:hypothetical protein
MAQNLITAMGNDPSIHENKFYMLWNAILNYHFPLDKDYGVAPQTSITGTGTKPEYLVVKIAREEEHVVVVVELKKPLEETEAGKEKVMKELVEYIEERFDETKFSSIYGVGGIGLSWTAFRMDRAGSHQPQILVPWRSNITSSWAFDTFKTIVSDIDKMTAPHEVWPVASLCKSYADQLLSRTTRIHHNDPPGRLHFPDQHFVSPHEPYFLRAPFFSNTSFRYVMFS